MFSRYANIFLAVFSTFLKLAQLDDLVGCGGFIRSNVTINYSRVEVKLLTKLGSLKYQTEGAPNNGYYLIPLYDKGEYVLRVEPPKGWSFEPSAVDLHVDGSTDPCSAGRDIDFTFQGFSIFGKVVSRGEEVGPPGVTVQLLDPAGHVLQTTTTEEGGAYMFSRVMPAEYSLLATHPSWDVQDARVPIRVTDDNRVAAKTPQVAGYDVSGEVQSEGDPIGGVHFILATRIIIPDHKKPRDCKATKPPPGFVLPPGLTFLCSATSGNSGLFAFAAVAPGPYVLLPFYKGEHMEFDMAPAQVEFTVGHGSYRFADKFQVRGFSVGGRVGLTAKGPGIAGALVYLDGRHTATTDNNGAFRLENMKPGQYAVEVRTEGLVFESHSFKVTPATPQLPIITPSHFKVCGTIEGGQRRLSVRGQHEREPLTVTADASGNFCAMLRAGAYDIVPFVSQQEEKTGLRFVPNSIRFAVPVEEGTISFVRFRAEIGGSIACIDGCGTGVRVMLRGMADGDVKTTETEAGGQFTFGGLSAGLYRLTVDHAQWCWERDSVDVRVAEGDVSGIVLRQKGFKVTVTSSHEATLEVLDASGSKRTITVPRGESHHCLPERGLYLLRASGCHEFQESDLKFDTENPAPISLTAIKHALGGTVTMDENVTDVVITAAVVGGPTLVATLEGPALMHGNKLVQGFQFMIPPGVDVELVPKSGRLLFSPASYQLTSGEDCKLDAVHFEGRAGLFIEGRIRPPLDGVKIVVRAQDQSEATTESDARGTFRVGPLDPQAQYDVEATKAGYVLKPTGILGHFEAFKFAEVEVEVEEGGLSLPGVLVSLSGGVDYRNHSRTGEDGKLRFPNLSPGNYFLRPIMKEYRFTPSSKMVTVAEGATVQVQVRAERIAFSCLGSVTSITGEAEAGVALEAQGTAEEGSSTACSTSQEEALSEVDGSFRLRGLLPNCSYLLRLKRSQTGVNAHIERASPPHILLRVGSEDIVGTRVIVFRFFNQMDVTGTVVADAKQPNNLKLRLFTEDSPDQVLQTVNVGLGGFFQLSPVTRDGRTYCVRIEGVGGGSAPPACFVGDGPHLHLSVPWKSPSAAPAVTETPDPLGGRPSLLLVLSLLLVAVMLFSGGGPPRGGRIREALGALVTGVRGLAKGAQGAPEGRADASPAELRRRARPRRT